MFEETFRSSYRGMLLLLLLAKCLFCTIYRILMWYRTISTVMFGRLFLICRLGSSASWCLNILARDKYFVHTTYIRKVVCYEYIGPRVVLCQKHSIARDSLCAAPLWLVNQNARYHFQDILCTGSNFPLFLFPPFLSAPFLGNAPQMLGNAAFISYLMFCFAKTSLQYIDHLCPELALGFQHM
jgi:hypothetical protein